MQLLKTMFNNGSQSWILLVLLFVCIGYFGYKTFVSHTSGYHHQTKTGAYVDDKPSLWSNGWFYLLLISVVGIIMFMVFINADY